MVKLYPFKITYRFLVFFLLLGMPFLVKGQLTSDVSFNSIDQGFGFGDGFDSDVRDLKVQPDGKILVVGNFTKYNGASRNGIARLKGNAGGLDSGFVVGTGIGGGQVYRIGLQANGRIVLAGSFTTYNGTAVPGIVRLLPNGAIDGSFLLNGPGPNPAQTITALHILSNGKIMVGGSFSTFNGQPRGSIVRLNSNGNLDLAFDAGSGGPGTGPNSVITEVKSQMDGKILVAGLSKDFFNGNAWGNSTARMAFRLLPDGEMDNTFDPLLASDNFGTAYTMEVDNSGFIYIGGVFSGAGGSGNLHNLVKLNSNGSINFGYFPGFPTSVYRIKLQGASLLVTTAASLPGSKKMMRFDASGNADLTFGDLLSATETGANGIFGALDLAPDGTILVGGSFTRYDQKGRNNIARLTSNGLVGAPLSLGSGADRQTRAVARQADGKFIVAGDFGYYNWNASNSVARINADGSFDASFSVGFGVNGVINSVAIQSDGRILLAGKFEFFNNQPRKSIIRVNSNGSIDNTFDAGIGTDDTIFKVRIQNDGKILVGGGFSDFSGINSPGLIRLNPNGSHDASFSVGTGFDGAVRAINILDNASIFVGGNFSNYNSNPRNGIIRLTMTGAFLPANNFGPGVNFGGSVRVIDFQTNKQVVFGGKFTSYNGGVTQTTAVGNGLISGSGFAYNPFHHQQGGQKSQVIIRASELIAKGMSAGNITSLSYDIAQVGASLNGFQIQMGNTGQTSSTNTAISAGLVTVYANAVQGFVLGTNSLTFSTPFAWDGSSNIVISVCWSNNNNGGASTKIRYEMANYQASMALYANNTTPVAVCLANQATDINGSATVSFFRPNMILGATGLITTGNLARISPIGLPDPTFESGNAISGTVYDLNINLSNNTIIAVGNFLGDKAGSRNHIIRLKGNAKRPDGGGEEGDGASDPINGIVSDESGKLIIVGDFNYFDTDGTNRVARLEGEMPETTTWWGPPINGWDFGPPQFPDNPVNVVINRNYSGPGFSCFDLLINSSFTFSPSGSVEVFGNCLSLSGNTGGHLIFKSADDSQEFRGFANDLTVDNPFGVSVEGPSVFSGTLKLQNGDLSTNDNLTLKSSSSGTARLAKVETGASITGSVTVEQYVPGPAGWHLVAPPVLGKSQSDWNFSLPEGSIFIHDEAGTLNSGLQVNGWIYPTLSTLELGKGYRVFLTSSGFTTRITGPLHTGSFDFTPYLGNTPTGYGGGGWNFLGNPFACEIDWHALSGSNVGSEIHIWNASHYGSYSSGSMIGVNGVDRYIPSGQGFFVKASGPFPTLMVTESAKPDPAENPTFLRVATADPGDALRIWIKDAMDKSDEIALRWMPQATGNFDPSFDAHKFQNEGLSLYSMCNDGERAAIQARPFVDGEIVNLGFSVKEEGNYSLQFAFGPDLTADRTWYLRDNEFGQIFSLSPNHNFPFVVSGGVLESNWRFSLLGINNPVSNKSELKVPQIVVVPNPARDFFLIRNAADVKSVSVFDVSGKRVARVSNSGLNEIHISTQTLQTGIYQLHLQTNSTVKTEKLIVQ